MAILSWGKPKIEICRLVNGVLPTTPTWIVINTPMENTTELKVTKGEKLEAKIEGGENEGVKYKSNTYQLVFNIRSAAGRIKPIIDVDGVVNDEYAVRLTPENPVAPGFIIDKASVSVEDNFKSADGGVWIFTFDVLKPATGSQVKWQVIAP